MGDLRSLVIEYFAAQDAKRCAADLRDGVPPHHSHRGEPWDSAYLLACERAHAADVALRAAVATPPDTGWRDRAPYSEEVYAHKKAHPVILGRPRGLWMVRGPDVLPTVVPMYTDGEDVVAAILDETIRCHALPIGERNPVGYWWRPLTASGDPCAWPEVTP